MADIVWEGTTDNSWDTTSNWSTGSVPGAGSNVQIPAGSPDITSGLDQSSVALGSVWISDGYTGKIGDDTTPHQPTYLQLDCDSFRNDGACTGYFKFVHSSGTIPVIIANTATPNTGKYGVSICGTGTIDVDVRGGYVGLAYLITDTVVVDNLTASTGVIHVGMNSTVADAAISGGTVNWYSDQTSSVSLNIENGTVNMREWKVSGSHPVITLLNGILNANHWTTSPYGISVKGGTCILDNGIERTLSALTVDGGSVSLDPDIVTVTTLSGPTQRRTISVI